MCAVLLRRFRGFLYAPRYGHRGTALSIRIVLMTYCQQSRDESPLRPLVKALASGRPLGSRRHTAYSPISARSRQSLSGRRFVLDQDISLFPCFRP